jgi:hypothetical protein
VLATLNALLQFVRPRSARISALEIVLSNNPCERIGQWETGPILKEDRLLEHVQP